MTTQEFIDVIKGMSVLELNDLVKACEEELTEVGAEKIKVIKVVRELTGLGLKEAKEAVEAAPKVIKEATTKEDAESIKAKLEEAGAKVTLK